MNRQEAIAKWKLHKADYENAGLILPGVTMYVPDEWKRDDRSIARLAMDAQPSLTTDPNAAIPAMLTTAIDPDVIRVVFAPLAMAEILTERKAGNWLEETRIFPVVEDTGEVSSYDDYSTSGRTGLNFNYPSFQSYLYQVILGYGERETERAGLMRINYVGDLNRAAAGLLNRFGNFSYAFGVAGLQNYGILNNPFLSAAITPAVKAWGGTTWFNSGSPAASANEVYNDILALVKRLIAQTNGALDMESPMTLAMSPTSALAMKFANSFGVYVEDLLKKGFPKMTVKTAIQYGASSTSNTQGSTAEVMQVIADELEGQRVAYAAFNEKMRAHKLVPELSSWKQKMTSGVWGTILRIPAAVASMSGI